jgi:hypothetical protein
VSHSGEVVGTSQADRSSTVVMHDRTTTVKAVGGRGAEGAKAGVRYPE